jgi:hypothetical protein
VLDFGWRRETRVVIESMEEKAAYIHGVLAGMLGEHETPLDLCLTETTSDTPASRRRRASERQAEEN